MFATRLHAQATTDSLVATTINDDQMKRGVAVFNKVCSACHTKNDMTGGDFKIKWNGRPVFDLFNVIHTTMPDDAPGTLTLDQYADVSSYLLRMNGAPGGGAPLVGSDTTALRKMRIDIMVPAPNIDSLLPKTDTLKFHLTSTRSSRFEAIMTRPYRAR
ncbi:MAG: cytochrome c [Gemmatimonadota bacterium]|nr:cytochrome c [Gemmatimonadota bacterium]